MRVIAGQWRGGGMDAPSGGGAGAPRDRGRETRFSLLANRPRAFENPRLAGPFAGSGALGFEALSRGAASATFVESDSRAAATVRRNAEKLGAAAHVVTSSALALPRSEPFDLILADPPYAPGAGSAVVQSVQRADWLAP